MKRQLWTKTVNAAKREWLERFNNDSFELAMTAMKILNFSPKNPTKKLKNILAFQRHKRFVVPTLVVT